MKYLYQRLKKNLWVLFNISIKSLILNKPIYVFHHIPKCGGTSIREAISKWFIVINDYRPVKDELYIENRVNLKKLKSYHCLVGHYGTPETYLFTRYPEIKNNFKFRVFSFVREPLSLRISLYYYEKAHGIIKKNDTLENQIIRRPNYISSILNCNNYNYKKVIDSYFFIGVFEKIDESFKILAKLTKKQQLDLHQKNVSEKDNQYRQITETIMEKFKTNNELDYKVYEYCLKKYEDYLSILNL